MAATFQNSQASNLEQASKERYALDLSLLNMSVDTNEEDARVMIRAIVGS